MMPRYSIGDVVRVNMGVIITRCSPGCYYDRIHNQKCVIVDVLACEAGAQYTVLLSDGEQMHINEVYLMPMC